MQKKKCVVYFYYDIDGELLYIGKSLDVGARWNGHTEPWMKDVAEVGIIECPDRAGMDVLESYCIAKLPSKYNKGGTEHGYTELDLFDATQQIRYSVEDFKDLFVQNPKSVDRISNKESKYAVNVVFNGKDEERIRTRAKKWGIGVATYIKMVVALDLNKEE